MKSKKWLISMGLAVVLIVAFALPACGDGTTEPASRLNIAVTAMPNSLTMDQLDLQNTNLGTLYLLLVYEPLYAYPKVDPATLESNPDAAYGFAPRLVKDYSWSYEGNDQILTLDLEEEVKWHDGEDFTADDVVYSFKSKVVYPWAPNMPINWTSVNDPGYSWCYGDICPKDILVTATDNYTVELRYVQDWHQPEDYLPNDFLWYSIVPEHVFGPDGEGEYDGWAENATWDGEYIGTGPFKVKGYEVDQYLLLERNDDYWGDLPAAKEVLFKLFEDENAMWMAFESNDPNSLMDLAIAGVPFPKKPSYEADSRITVEVLPDLSIACLGFNLHPTKGYAPLAHLPLRQAIAAAIDKENMCEMIAGNYSKPADSWVYLESQYHYGGHDYGALPNNAYNLTKAAEILTNAGYTKDGEGYWCANSTRISFEIASTPGHHDEALLIAEDLQRGTIGDPGLGLDVSAPPMDSTTFYDILYTPNLDNSLEAFVWADDPGPDPWSDWIWCYFADPEDWGYMWNPTWYDDEEFDALFWENYLATDMVRKAEIIEEMQLMMAEDIPVVFLQREDIITACRTDRWDDWFNEMGGYATWINEYSIREVTPVPVD